MGKRKWNRVTLGAVQLPIGSRTILFRSTGSRPLGKFFSLELVTPQAEENLGRLSRQQASSTDWMVAAKYGLMFHWTSQTKPRSIPKTILKWCATLTWTSPRYAAVSQMGAGLGFLRPRTQVSIFQGQTRLSMLFFLAGPAQEIWLEISPALWKRQYQAGVVFPPWAR